MVVIVFLMTTLSGFLYTVLRVRLLYVPWPLTYLSYSAMAPYQGFAEGNKALMAEGMRPEGNWEEIDLSPYFPFSRGKQDIRMLEVGWLRMASRSTGDHREHRTRCVELHPPKLMLDRPSAPRRQGPPRCKPRNASSRSRSSPFGARRPNGVTN